VSFVYAAGPRQRSLSRVRVPWHLWPYFTLSDLRLPFSSPPTTRRVTVEVFDPASTQLLLRTPINPGSYMRENALIVASLPTRSRDPSLLLLHPSVHSCCLATKKARRGEAMRRYEGLVHSSVLFGSARLSSARRKHRFVYCCIIAGVCFDVTILAWRIYATICCNVCGKS
jgi:hypothetical protein